MGGVFKGVYMVFMPNLVKFKPKDLVKSLTGVETSDSLDNSGVIK